MYPTENYENYEKREKRKTKKAKTKKTTKTTKTKKWRIPKLIIWKIKLEDKILADHKNSIYYKTLLHECSNGVFQAVGTIYEVPSANYEKVNKAGDVIVNDGNNNDDEDPKLHTSGAKLGIKNSK